jgi:hypothetical protein
VTQLTLESLAERLTVLERKVAEFVRPGDDPPGTTGDEQSDDPAAVARWVAAFDALPPLIFTPAEEAAWQSARAEQKKVDVAARERFATDIPGAGE